MASNTSQKNGDTPNSSDTPTNNRKSRKDKLRRIEDLLADRLLTLLEDPSTKIRGSTLGVISQYLRLRATELDTEEERQEEESDRMRRIWDDAIEEAGGIDSLPSRQRKPGGAVQPLFVPTVDAADAAEDGDWEDEDEPDDF